MLQALTLAVLVAAAAAIDRSQFTVNDLLKRQEGSSGAQYQCHSDCGFTILDASAENCDNSTWTDLLSNCEECANTYNILRHYGDQVESAGQDCGIDVTFQPSGGASASGPAETSSAVAETASDAASHASTTSAPSSTDATAATTTTHGTTASGAIVPSAASNASTLATSSATPSAAVEESTGAGATLVNPFGAVFAALTVAAVVFQTFQ